VRILGRLPMGAPHGLGVEWEATVELARQHRVSPLLFWRLVQRSRGAGGQVGREEWAAIPREVKESLRDDFGAAVLRANMAERQLAEAVGALVAAGVPVMVVKGAAVAAFYPDRALRNYSDLDLLVPRAQVGQAEVALNGLGYRYMQPKDWALTHHFHLPPMVRDGAPMAVEVHWRLDDTRRVSRLPDDDLWSRAVSWSVEGQAVQRLEAVDAVLHLCRHSVVQHRLRAGLASLCDVAQVTLEWCPGEWEALVQRAVASKLRCAMYLILTLAEQVLGWTAPPAVLAALRPPNGEALPGNLAELLLGPVSRPKSRAFPALVRTWARKTRAARLRRLLRYLFPPRHRLALEYRVPDDSLRLWLAYLWWPVDLLRRYGWIAWDILRGKQAMRATWEREDWLEQWLAQEAGGEHPEIGRPVHKK